MAECNVEFITHEEARDPPSFLNVLLLLLERLEQMLNSKQAS